MINKSKIIGQKYKEVKAFKKLSPLGCLVLLLILPFGAKAQSYDSLINVALNNNLELKILEQQYRTALEKAPQVNQRPDPEAGIGVFPLPVETRLGAQLIRASATQMFYWKGVLDSKKEVELAKAKALFEKIAIRSLTLGYQVKKAWLQLYELQASQKIIDRNFELLGALERLALAKVESGKGSTADVLRIQLKVQELQQELAILETAKAKPLAELNQLLNRPLASSVLIQDSLNFANIPYNRDSISARIKEGHPMLKMFELQQEVSQKVLAANQLDGKPMFGAGLDYILVNKRNDAEPASNGRDIIQLRGTVKIPLYKQKYEAKEREELIKIQTLDNQKLDALSRFNTAIEKAYTDYETAKLKIELYEKQIEVLQATIPILETNYSVKGSGFDELLQLEKELIDYDLKIMKAIVQSHLAKVTIEQFLIKS